MRKFFTLLALLAMFVNGATADTTVTYGLGNGTFYDAEDSANPSGFNARKFVSNTTPAVTVIASDAGQLNSTDAASGSRLGLNNGTNTFTISVPEGYVIVGYSFDCKAVQTGHPARTLTTESGQTLNIPTGNNTTWYSVSETDINQQSTYFTVTTTNWSPINTRNFKIYVKEYRFNIVYNCYDESDNLLESVVSDEKYNNGATVDVSGFTHDIVGYTLQSIDPTSVTINGANAEVTVVYAAAASFDYTVAINDVPAGTVVTVKGDAVSNGSEVSYPEAVTESDIDVDFPSGYDYCSYTVAIVGATITINGYPYIEKTNAGELENGYYVIQGVSKEMTGFWYHDLSQADNRLFRMSTTSSPDILSDIDHFTGNLKYVWKLTTNQDGSFTLQNVGTDAFAPADTDRNKNFTGTEPANFVWDSDHAAIYQTNYTYNEMTMYIHCNAPSGDLNLSYWTTGPSGVNTGTGTLVAPRFFKVSDVAILKVLLQQRIDEAELYPVGAGLNHYTAPAGFDDALDAAKSEVANDAATKASLDEACENLETAVAGITLNMPAANTFLRVRLSALKVAAQPYLLGERSDLEGHTDRLAYSTDADNANSIWCYDGTHFYNYGRGGLAFVNNGGHADVSAAAGTEGVAIAFEPSYKGELGAYNIKFDGNRYLYGEADAYANAGSDANGNGYSFNLELVDELPVTISSVGFATLYSPVALTIPSGVTAYTGYINGSCLKLDALSEKIPAATAVILEGEANNYTFAITTADNFDGDNDLSGSVGGVADTKDNILTLQNYNEKLGLYNYTGETLNGFKAYLDKSALGAGVHALTFEFDDATGIEAIDNGQLTMDNAAIYNLAGQRVQKATKGLYIVNGKKVVLK